MGYKSVRFAGDPLFLVTGGAGFIGSNICEVLVKKGCRVRILDNLSTGKHGNIAHLKSKKNFELIVGDIRDLNTCEYACRDVTYVLHQAAWGSVPRSIEKPLLYDETNIRGTLNMLEAARKSSVARFIYASSSAVYGDEPSNIKREYKVGKVLSPYALTKRVNEEYARMYFEFYGLNTIGLRYFNVFGQRQDPEGPYAAVVPKFISQLLRDEAPSIYGDGLQTRDFTYVKNVVEVNLKACLAPDTACGELFNVAYGQSENLLDIYAVIAEALGKDIEPEFLPEREGDIKFSVASVWKAHKLLNYRPNFDFNRGLLETLPWYIENLGEPAGG